MESRQRLQHRDALPREEGDMIREYNAMHEENSMSSWPREDVVEKGERRKNDNERVREGEEREREKMGKERRIRAERERRKRTIR